MGFISPYYVVFVRERLFTLTSLPEIWRLVTPFLLTGPKLGLILDPYFLYTYGSQLETEASRFQQPGDFFTYLVFVAVVILVSACCSLPHFILHQSNLVYLPGQPHSSCHGSWKRGRVPLHSAKSIIRKIH
jgi:Derlin-2/3